MIKDGRIETQCTQCSHKKVCMHMNDFCDIHGAVFNAEVLIHHEDGTVSMRKVVDFDCLDDIVIKCRYFKKELPEPKHINRTIEELSR